MLPNNCFIYTKDEIKNLTTSKLFGYAWTENHLIFGTDGINEYLNNNSELPTEGRFCGIFLDKNRDKISIYTDFTAQETLYLFQNGEDWAISNSFMLLSKVMGKKYNLSFYPPAANCFHLKNGVHLGEQLISHKTMVKEIIILPITDRIEVNRIDGSLKIIKADYYTKLYRKNINYYDLILNFLERGSGALEALIDLGLPIDLFLSGGYDSRIVLGMLSKIYSYQDRINVYSHENKLNDFNSAKMLVNHLGIKNFNLPNQKNINKALSASDAIRMYMLSCGGVYLPFYSVRNKSLDKNLSIRLTGDQPVGRSHFEGRAIFNGSMTKVSTDIYSFLKAQSRNYIDETYNDFLSVFNDIGIDIKDPLSQLAYYQSIRSRFHCGRNWYKSLGNTFLFTPLMQHDILLIDLISQESHYPNKMFADIFSALGDWALNIPFESKDRGFYSSLLNNSPFRKGINFSPRKTYVYGDPRKNNFFDTSLDLLSVEMNFNDNDERIKDSLSRIYYQCKYVKDCDVFSKDDFNNANLEIKNKASLSHHYRKMMHIICTEIILGLTIS